MTEYPVDYGDYRGYSLTGTTSFLTNRVKAEKDGDVHTRIYRPKRTDVEEAIEKLKSDVDNYGVFEDEE